MAWHRFLFRAGAVVWILGGLGHFALIDVLTLHGRTGVAKLAPHADVLATMEATTLSVGALGSTTVFRAAAGFSLWVALSLVFLGATYLLLSRAHALALRPFILLGVIVSTVFGVLAAVCFIVPPTFGAVLATALFVASWVRNEN
jgi:uncharacterized membrane protein